MRVVWTRAALEGLETITDYVAQHNLAAALRLVDDIPERTNALLADNPMIGRVGRVAGTRELVLSGTPYIVAYQVSDQVDVLAVMHGARQWPEDFGAP
jgi:addiction module RelE/StbE family toxin